MALNNFKRNHLISLQFEGLNLIHFRNARSVHCNLISMAFQDHVFKCRFGKIANLKLTAMNNCQKEKRVRHRCTETLLVYYRMTQLC